MPIRYDSESLALQVARSRRPAFAAAAVRAVRESSSRLVLHPRVRDAFQGWNIVSNRSCDCASADPASMKLISQQSSNCLLTYFITVSADFQRPRTHIYTRFAGLPIAKYNLLFLICTILCAKNMRHEPASNLSVSVPVLLEHQAAICVGLVDVAINPRAKRFIRLLAVDLMVEAEKQRVHRTNLSSMAAGSTSA